MNEKDEKKSFSAIARYKKTATFATAIREETAIKKEILVR